MLDLNGIQHVTKTSLQLLKRTCTAYKHKREGLQKLFTAGQFTVEQQWYTVDILHALHYHAPLPKILTHPFSIAGLNFGQTKTKQ